MMILLWFANSAGEFAGVFEIDCPAAGLDGLLDPAQRDGREL